MTHPVKVPTTVVFFPSVVLQSMKMSALSCISVVLVESAGNKRSPGLPPPSPPFALPAAEPFLLPLLPPAAAGAGADAEAGALAGAGGYGELLPPACMQEDTHLLVVDANIQPGDMLTGASIVIRVIVRAVTQSEMPSRQRMTHINTSDPPAKPPRKGISAALQVRRTIWPSLGMLNLSMAAARAFCDQLSSISLLPDNGSLPLCAGTPSPCTRIACLR